VLHALRVKPGFRKEIHPSLCDVVMRGTLSARSAMFQQPFCGSVFQISVWKSCRAAVAVIAHRRRVFLGPSDTPSFP
jgi:predicted adenine nucleotide alpha hydrolase (AANH) superfamily ATPase